MPCILLRLNLKVPPLNPPTHARAACAHEALARRDPHVFAIAAGAFRALVREGVSQSVVITGESGAGKTETTKKVMQFLAALAGGNGVEDQVLEVSYGQGQPVLFVVGALGGLGGAGSWGAQKRRPNKCGQAHSQSCECPR
jgi:myosin protein heavy chain